MKKTGEQWSNELLLRMIRSEIHTVAQPCLWNESRWPSKRSNVSRGEKEELREIENV
jgi:hypothetical protein